MTHPESTGRTGLVLAAGYGTRHPVLQEATPKPLLLVAGRALILRSLEGLEQAGCSRIVVVLGHQGDAIRRFLDSHYSGSSEIVFVTNPRFDLQNGVSVLAARELLPPQFVMTMGDHVFDSQTMELLRGRPFPSVGGLLVVDFKLRTILDMDDATKVWVEDGRVLRIGKALTPFNAVDSGLFLAGHDLLRSLEDVLAERGDASLSHGVSELARIGHMEALDLGAGLWQDVDTPEMLLAAERLFHRPAPQASR